MWSAFEEAFIEINKRLENWKECYDSILKCLLVKKKSKTLIDQDKLKTPEETWKEIWFISVVAKCQ